jgi:hypothetical protein
LFETVALELPQKHLCFALEKVSKDRKGIMKRLEEQKMPAGSGLATPCLDHHEKS